MTVTKKEQKVLKKTKLRNLKRRYAKIKEHADLTEQAIEIKADIDALERELNQLQ